MSPSRAFESNGYENYIFSASGDRQHCGNLSLRQGQKERIPGERSPWYSKVVN
jgi:hypothetical protein